MLAQRLGVELHAPQDALARSAYEWTLRLNRGAAYDSFYLALAERLRCELWTADQRLVRTTSLPWVRLAGATA
jgi:predicted nucleic acid-binding protein